MVTVTIGDMVRSFETRTSIDESWVNQQIQARKRAGTEPCIKVQIRMRDLELTLVSAACNCGGGGGSLTPAQQASPICGESSGYRTPPSWGGAS